MDPLTGSAIVLFQFHKGTIRTEISPYSYAVTIKFQFHKGTIRTRWNKLDQTTFAISIP